MEFVKIEVGWLGSLIVGSVFLTMVGTGVREKKKRESRTKENEMTKISVFFSINFDGYKVCN